MTSRDDEGFLERWSRRKQAAQSEHAGRDLKDEEAPADENAAAVGEDVTDASASTGAPEVGNTNPQDGGDTPHAEVEAANREAAEAVDLEALSYESDYSVFLKKGVPTALKNAALRKLWSSNPVLANVDGLNDYDEDFRLGNQFGREFKSAWEVGRGYGRKIDEMNAKLAEERRLAALAGDAPGDEGNTRDGDAVADETAAVQDTSPSIDDGAQVDRKVPEAVATAPEATSTEETPSTEEGNGETLRKVSLRRRMSFSREP